MGSVQCSICTAGADASNAVNEALAKGEFLQTIAARFGFSKSAIHRHKRGKCEHSFLVWKAARIRARREKTTGRRIVTRWFGLEGGSSKPPVRHTVSVHSRFTVDSRLEEISAADVRPDDILVDVVFDEPRPARRRPEVIVVGSPETPSARI
jgi:hypothetical protein